MFAARTGLHHHVGQLLVHNIQRLCRHLLPALHRSFRGHHRELHLWNEEVCALLCLYAILKTVTLHDLANRSIKFFMTHYRFEKDIEDMLGHAPNRYWKIMWRAVSPLLLICLLIYYIVNYVQGGTPTYQAWHKETVSWILLFSAQGYVCRPSLTTPSL